MVSWVTRDSGAYRVEVRSSENAAVSGIYTIHLDVVRDAEPADKGRMQAEMAGRAVFAQAKKTAAGGQPEAQRAAIQLYMDSLELWRAADLVRGEAESRMHLCVAKYEIHDSKAAIEDCKVAVQLFHDAHDGPGEGAVRVYLATIYGVQQAGEAIAVATPVLDLLQEKPEAGFRASALTLLGALSSLSNVKQALAYLEQAIELWQEVGDPLDQRAALRALCGLYIVVGQPERVADCQKRVDAIPHSSAAQEHEPNLAALELEQAGLQSLLRDAFQDAIPKLQAARERWRDLHQPAPEAAVDMAIGAAWAGLHRDDQALKWYEMAIRVSAGGVLDATAQIARGEVCLKNNDNTAALAAFRAALAQDNPFVRMRAHAGIARAERRDNPEAARNEMRLSIEAVAEARNSIPGNDWRESYTDSIQDLYSFWIELLMAGRSAASSTDDGWNAFEANESARLAGLTELLEEARVDIFKDADPALLARYRGLQLEISRLTRQALSGPQQAGVPDKLKSELDQLRNTRRDLIGKSKRARDLVAPPLPSLAEIQNEILDDRTVLLEYWLGEESSTLWVITRTEFHALTLNWSRSQIEAAARRWLSRLDRKAAAVRADPDGRELSRQLLAPALAWLGDKRILIVPYGVLNRVPFAALPDPAYAKQAGARFLLKSHELAYAPSVSAVQEIRNWHRARGSAGQGIALVVDPVYARDDTRVKGPVRPRADLPADAAEARTAAAKALGLTGCTGLSRVLGTTQVLTNAAQPGFRIFGRQTLESGGKATVANIKGAGLRNVRVVHFGAHACVSSTNPELSALALSQWDLNGRPIADSFLHVKDVYDLQWKADLVVLAACETALGKETPSGGVDGLARAFHYAGAPSVIASLWDAGDADTGILMQHFYDALNPRAPGGMQPAAALRAAQLKMIESSPHIWAAFVLQGDWETAASVRTANQ